MTKPTITQEEVLADAICGCANRDQHRRDVALIKAFREAAVAELQAEIERKDAALRLARSHLRYQPHPLTTHAADEKKWALDQIEAALNPQPGKDTAHG